MEDSHHALLTVGIAMMAGVICQSLARHIRFPAIILLLLAGAALGPEWLGWVKPRSLGAGLFGLVEMGIAIILFEGGLNLQASRLRRQERPIRFLVTLGALITFIGASLAAYYLMEWTWQLAILFGSLVIVTGPTVVSPLLRDMRLHPRLKTILEAEGVLIDPVGAIAASIALQIVLAPSVTEELGAASIAIVQRLGFGLIAGVAGGALLGSLLKFRRIIPHGLENIFALAFVLLLFTGCEAVFPNSGIMAVTVAGVAVGWISKNSERALHEFKDQLTILLIGLLFILLAADIRLSDVISLGTKGALVMIALVVLVRPLCVYFSTMGSNLSVKEKSFIGWVAPRGIVAAAITSITADTLTLNGIEGGAQLRGLVFLTIATTVVLAGLTARPVASLLKLRLPNRNRVAILSADGLGIALGDELKRHRIPVVFLDSDPKRCESAQKRGHNVVYGDAIEERTLTRAQFELVGTAIGLSGNDHLNSLFIAHAREYFGVPKGLVALEVMPGNGLPAHIRKIHGDVVFDGAHDTERWDVRLRHNQLKVDYFMYQPPEPEAKTEGDAPAANLEDVPEKPTAGASNNEKFVILAVHRAGKLNVMSMGFKLKKGDIAAVAVYEPDFDAALELLARRGWTYPVAVALERKEPAAES